MTDQHMLMLLIVCYIATTVCQQVINWTLRARLNLLKDWVEEATECINKLEEERCGTS